MNEASTSAAADTSNGKPKGKGGEKVVVNGKKRVTSNGVQPVKENGAATRSKKPVAKRKSAANANKRSIDPLDAIMNEMTNLESQKRKSKMKNDDMDDNTSSHRGAPVNNNEASSSYRTPTALDLCSMDNDDSVVFDFLSRREVGPLEIVLGYKMLRNRVDPFSNNYYVRTRVKNVTWHFPPDDELRKELETFEGDAQGPRTPPGSPPSPGRGLAPGPSSSVPATGAAAPFEGYERDPDQSEAAQRARRLEVKVYLSTALGRPIDLLEPFMSPEQWHILGTLKKDSILAVIDEMLDKVKTTTTSPQASGRNSVAMDISSENESSPSKLVTPSPSVPMPVPISALNMPMPSAVSTLAPPPPGAQMLPVTRLPGVMPVKEPPPVQPTFLVPPPLTVAPPPPPKQPAVVMRTDLTGLYNRTQTPSKRPAPVGGEERPFATPNKTQRFNEPSLTRPPLISTPRPATPLPAFAPASRPPPRPATPLAAFSPASMPHPRPLMGSPVPMPVRPSTPTSSALPMHARVSLPGSAPSTSTVSMQGSTPVPPKFPPNTVRPSPGYNMTPYPAPRPPPVSRCIIPPMSVPPPPLPMHLQGPSPPPMMPKPQPQPLMRPPTAGPPPVSSQMPSSNSVMQTLFSALKPRPGPGPGPVTNSPAQRPPSAPAQQQQQQQQSPLLRPACPPSPIVQQQPQPPQLILPPPSFPPPRVPGPPQMMNRFRGPPPAYPPRYPPPHIPRFPHNNRRGSGGRAVYPR